MSADIFTKSLERSFETYKNNFAAYIIAFAIAFLVSFIIPFLIPPMFYGMTYMGIKGAREGKTQIEDLFEPFRSLKTFARSYFYGFVVFLIIVVLVVVFLLIFAGLIFVMSGEYSVYTPEAFLAALLAAFVLFIVSVVISVGLLYSDVIYVMDTETGVLNSMAQSVSLTGKNIAATVCLLAAMYIINLIGSCAGGILVILTFPFSVVLLSHLTIDLKEKQIKDAEKENDGYEDVEDGEEEDGSYEYAEFEEEYVEESVPDTGMTADGAGKTDDPEGSVKDEEYRSRKSGRNASSETGRDNIGEMIPVVIICLGSDVI